MQFPPTSGKIIMDTSHGELEIELWCKEVPKGCRNFIQLCLEGYYDNCKFHRLFPNFMIQGGDPTGTGEGGKSSYGHPFQDEFHSRLSFITRGILAYSNEGANTNESQFFITFDSCTWLDKKHTIFGRVVGNTIYNLMSMNSVDTDQNDQPITPIFIKTTQVIIDPYNLCLKEIEPKKPEEAPVQIQVEQKPQPKTKPKTKNISLLSFGEEEEEQEENKCISKIGNSHDRLNDPKLKKESAITQEELDQKRKQQQEEEQKINTLKQAISKPKVGGVNNAQQLQKFQIKEDELDINEEDKKLLNYKIKKNAKGEIQYVFDESSYSSKSESSEIEDEEQRKLREQQFEEYEKLKADFLQFKENKFGSNNAMIKDRLAHEKKLLSTVEARRQRFLQDMKEQKHYEAYEDKISLLQEKLKDDKVLNDKYHWLNHKLKFHIDSASAYKVVETKQSVQDYHAQEIVNEDTYKFKKEQKSINKLLQLSE